MAAGPKFPGCVCFLFSHCKEPRATWFGPQAQWGSGQWSMVTPSCFEWGGRLPLGLQKRFCHSRWARQGPLPRMAALRLSPERFPQKPGLPYLREAGWCGSELVLGPPKERFPGSSKEPWRPSSPAPHSTREEGDMLSSCSQSFGEVLMPFGR